MAGRSAHIATARHYAADITRLTVDVAVSLSQHRQCCSDHIIRRHCLNFRALPYSRINVNRSLISSPISIICVNSRPISTFQYQTGMLKPWYVYIIIAVVAELLFMVCDKYKIIKSKILRYFIVFFVASIICWGIFDLVVAPE